MIDLATGKGVRPDTVVDVALYGPSRPRSGAAIESAKIAADGTFRIRAAPGANYVYLRSMQPTPGLNAYDLTVVEGETVEVEFKVQVDERP